MATILEEKWVGAIISDFKTDGMNAEECDALYASHEALRAENERLRAALLMWYEDDGECNCTLCEVSRAALAISKESK